VKIKLSSLFILFGLFFSSFNLFAGYEQLFRLATQTRSSKYLFHETIWGKEVLQTVLAREIRVVEAAHVEEMLIQIQKNPELLWFSTRLEEGLIQVERQFARASRTGSTLTQEELRVIESALRTSSLNGGLKGIIQDIPREYFVNLSIASADVYAYSKEAFLTVQAGTPTVSESWKVLGEYFNRYTSFDFRSYPLTFGVEVEALYPNYLTYDDLTRMVTRYIGERLPNAKITILKTDVYHEINYTVGGVDNVLMLTKDSSIIPIKGFDGVEIVSPILRSAEDQRFFLELIEELKTVGLRSEPHSSGLHIHVGFPAGEEAEAVAMTKIHSIIEAELMEAFSAAKNRTVHGYAKKIPEETIEQIDGILPRELNRVAWRPDGRYWSIDTQTVHETIEFRLFNSTLNTNAIELMIDYCGKFIKAVRAKDPRLVQYLQSGDDTLEGFVKALDVKLGKANEGILLDILRETKEGMRVKFPQYNETKISNLLAASIFAILLSQPMDFDEIK